VGSRHDGARGAKGRRTIVGQEGEPLMPDALTKLAESVSFAVMVDRPLLRAARLRYVPEADASLEAEFWFAPLIKTRGADGVTMLAEVADDLRRSVAADPSRLQDVREFTKTMHAHLPETTKLEEEIAFLSVSSGEAAARRIEMLLHSALAAMVDGGRDQLANWTARLLANLPTSVRLLPAARLLDAGARLRLGGDATAAEATDPALLPWLTPAALPRDSIGVRFTSSGLTFDASPEPRGERMAVPRTRPLLLRVSWTTAQNEAQSAQVTLRGGEATSLAIDANEVSVTTLTGESYSVRRGGSTPESVASAIFDFSELIERKGTIKVLDREDATSRVWRAMAKRASERPQSGSLIMVTGKPGSGKTALLACLANELTGVQRFTHFFEAGNPRTEDYELARRSLIAQMIGRFNLPASLMSLPLADVIRRIAADLPRNVPVAIFLDDVDVARDANASEILKPLSKLSPPFVVVASTITIAEKAILHVRTDMREPSFGVLEVIQASKQQALVKTIEGAFEDEMRWSAAKSEFVTAVAVARAPLHRNEAAELAHRCGLNVVPDSAFLAAFGDFVAMKNEAAAEFVRGVASSPRLRRAHENLATLFSSSQDLSGYALMHGPFHWREAKRREMSLIHLYRADLLERRMATYGARITTNYVEELGDPKARAFSTFNEAMRTHEARLDAAPHDLVPLLYPVLRDDGLTDTAINKLFSIDQETLPLLRPVRREHGNGPGSRLQSRVTKLRALPKQTVIAALESNAVLTFPLRDPFSPMVLGEHLDRVTAIAGASRWAASGSADGMVSFWSLPIGRLELQIDQHRSEIVAILAEDNRCYVCDSGGLITAWRIAISSTARRRHWRSPWQLQLPSGITAFVQSARWDIFSAGCRDGSIVVINANGKIISTAPVHRSEVAAIAIFGDEVISASADRVIRITLAGSGELVRELPTGHSLGIAGIGVSQMGKYVATWSADRSARVFRLASGQRVGIMTPHLAAITGAAFLSNENLMTCSADGAIAVSRFDGEPVARINHHDAPISAVAVSWPAKMQPVVITASDDRKMVAWQGRDGKVISEPSPAVTRIAAIEGGMIFHRGNIGVSVRSRTSTVNYNAEQFTVSDDGMLFVLSHQKRIALVGAHRQIEYATPWGPARHLAVDGLTIFASREQGGVVVLQDGRESYQLEGRYITALQTARDIVVAGTIDGEVWWIFSRASPMLLGRHEERVRSIVSSDIGFVISAADDGSISRWTARTGEIARVRTQVVRPRHIAIMSSGFFVAGDDGVIEMFEDFRAHSNARLDNHRDAVTGMVFDTRRNLLFSASADATIRVWEANRCIATHFGDVSFTAIALIDNRIVAGDAAGGLTWLSVGPEKLIPVKKRTAAPRQRPAAKRKSVKRKLK
jgi:WD40 repeat protein